MNHLKAHALLTCVNKRPYAVLFLAALFCFGQAQTQKGADLISNNIKILAGNGDTICLLSQGQTKLGVNYSIDNGITWLGDTLKYSDKTPIDLVYGAGYAIVPVYPADRNESSRIWRYSMSSKENSDFSIRWPDSYVNDTNYEYDFRVVDAAYVKGEFFLAAQDGGLLRYAPSKSATTVKAYNLGQSSSRTPAAFKPDFGVKPDSLKRVTAVSGFTTDSGTGVVLVTTPLKIWEFYPADSTWDTLSSSITGSNLTFHSFEVAVSDANGKELYAYVKMQVNKDSLQSQLFKYNRTTKSWELFLTKPPITISPVDQFIYTVQNKNEISLYEVNDSTTSIDPSPRADKSSFVNRMAKGNVEDYPLQVNDILYLQNTDSTGNLWIGSSQGLYLSEDEKIGTSTNTFKSIRYVSSLKPGLKQVYAVPGILSAGMESYGQQQRVSFIYNLGKDAKVTIQVFDYNMDLVKTIIKDQQRRAGTKTVLGRSTDPNADMWDGTNRFGRMVAPGVYYFKITTDTGERAFGKVIVAK